MFTNNEEKLDYTLAKCCNPIPGDKVFGFLTVQDGIKVHKKTCSNSISLRSKFAYRIINAKWIDSSQEDFNSIKIIEWPELVEIDLKNKLELHFKYSDKEDERELSILGQGKWKNININGEKCTREASNCYAT